MFARKVLPVEEFVAVTPSGDPMPWTRSRTAHGARRKVSPRWDLAEREGYTVRPVAVAHHMSLWQRLVAGLRGMVRA